jgi:predicted nucleic acid-binding protein
VDASTVIAALNDDEPSHNAALDLLASWDALVIHTVNVAEILAGVDPAAWTGLLGAMHSAGFAFCDTTAEELARAKVVTGLKMPDACVIAVAQARRADAVLSLDQRLTRAARAAGFACGSGE